MRVQSRSQSCRPRTLRVPWVMLAVDHHKAHGLFDHVVGGVDGRRGNELEVGLTVVIETLGHVTDQTVMRTAGGKDCLPDLVADLLQFGVKSVGAQLLLAVEGAEQGLDRGQQSLSVALDLGKGKLTEVFESRIRCARQYCTGTEHWGAYLR